MLKLILTYLSQARWARCIVQNWGFAKRTAARFVAGETLDEAILIVKELHSKGIFTTLDHLGENVTSRDESIQAADEIIMIMDRLVSEKCPIRYIDQIKPDWFGIGSENLSAKLSADPGERPGEKYFYPD